MDLYSASRRYVRPFAFSQPGYSPSLSLDAHGLIGDGHTAALVRVDGAIDWLCFPKFDSPSVFGALLDQHRGGFSAVTPAARPFESVQAYDPDTNVLETLFTVPGQGVVRLTDHMPWNDDPRSSIHEVHRRVECREGEVELEAVFDPRFDYGRTAPAIEMTEHGVLAKAGVSRLVAVLSKPARWHKRPEGGAAARFKLKRDERSWMILSWAAPLPEPLAAYRPFDYLRNTRRAWRQWSSALRYDGPFRHRVVRSALALKLLTYGPTGAMVAAPTTSLPEWLGGERNWDYRFTWTRDTAMSIRAANRIGYSREAREFFHFIRDALEANPRLEVMYSIDGGPVPFEEELGHLGGFAGSRPVRIGNGARDQLQLDTAGALVDAAYLHERTAGVLGVRAWRQLRQVIETIARSWREPDHGIWEPRNGVRHNVHSKLMSWVALDRGRRLAPRFGDSAHASEWAVAGKEVRDAILSQGFDAKRGHFVSAFGGNDVDAALLLLPVEGFLPAGDPRVLATIDAVRKRLGEGPFVYRYKANDGVSGAEGAFVLCGFWLAEALAHAGRIDEAQEVFVAHTEGANHLGLLSEEIDPSSGALLGNFPQAFSHLGLINAAISIDRALRQRDEAPLDDDRGS